MNRGKQNLFRITQISVSSIRVINGLDGDLLEESPQRWRLLAGTSVGRAFLVLGESSIKEDGKDSTFP